MSDLFGNPNCWFSHTQAHITGDGTANITYHFVKQIPSEPFSFDLYGDEVRLTPLPDLDVDDKRFPPTFILLFRLVGPYLKNVRWSFKK